MLKDKLMKKLNKKGDLDPLEKDAKLGVVKELSRQASGMMGSKVHPAMKAEISADSKEGLKAGLDKASHLVEGSPEEEAQESPAEELAEGDKEESDEEIEAEHADHSPEELDAKIQKLMALKHKKEAGQA